MTDTWENELRALFRPVHGLQPCQLASWTALPAFSTPQGLRDHIAVVDAGLIAEGQAGAWISASLSERCGPLGPFVLCTA